MTIRHEIETSCPSRSADAESMQHICDLVLQDHPGSGIRVNQGATNCRLLVRGNGSLLRDLIAILDRRSWLD